jgi:hypothetical protein
MLPIPEQCEHDCISERQHEKFRQLRQRGQARGRPSADRLLADRIIELREAGETLDAIAATLNDEGVANGARERSWPASLSCAKRHRDAAARASSSREPDVTRGLR